jgi:hypothetical protein
MSDVVVYADLSCDQPAESTWWIGLLSWVFIYVERKHHFSGGKMSGPVSLRKEDRLSIYFGADKCDIIGGKTV